VVTFVVPFGSSEREEVRSGRFLKVFSKKVQKDLVVTEKG